jgi:hypothetical protein
MHLASLWSENELRELQCEAVAESAREYFCLILCLSRLQPFLLNTETYCGTDHQRISNRRTLLFQTLKGFFVRRLPSTARRNSVRRAGEFTGLPLPSLPKHHRVMLTRPPLAFL